jgi:hypothetical protein
MTKEQRDAHLRMISTLGVRSHEGIYEGRGEGIRIETIPPALICEVRELLQHGYTDRGIKRRLKMGSATLRRIKEAIRRG